MPMLRKMFDTLNKKKELLKNITPIKSCAQNSAISKISKSGLYVVDLDARNIF